MKYSIETHDLVKIYDNGFKAVDNLNLFIEDKTIGGILGPNGAGKTTLFNLLTGVYEPSSGLIELMDQDKSIQIGGLKPYKITNLGVARTLSLIHI